jgi:hypothetical protein
MPTFRVALAAALIGLLVWAAIRRSADGPAGVSATSPDSIQVITDEGGMPILDQDGRTEKYLRLMGEQAGVDLRLLFTASPPQHDLEGYSLRRARELHLGATTGGRGLLFVYDTRGKRLRIEVTPALEGVFPDAFLGYLMRENTQGFFAADNPGLALRTTLRILHLRLRRAALGEDYDPAALETRDDPRRYAAGGGATTRFSQREGMEVFIRGPATADDSARLAPGLAVEQSFASYLLWLGSDRFITGLPLFTIGSRRILRTLPVTRGYFDFWRMTYWGRPHRAVERGDLAMVYFTTDPIPNPVFFRRVDGLWRYDAEAELP